MFFSARRSAIKLISSPEVRDDHRRHRTTSGPHRSLHDAVDLRDPCLVPVVHLFALFLCQTAPAAFCVQDDLRMNGRLALPEHHQDNHRTEDVTRR